MRNFIESKKAICLLLSITFAVALIVATKDSIKHDEFIVLKYIQTGHVLNVDSQLFHLFLYKIISFVFGISTFGLRTLPIFLYVVLIYELYKWGSEKDKKSGLMFGTLFLSNSYVLDLSIYAHSYTLYLLFAAIIFHQLENVVSLEKIGPFEIIKGGLISLLGVCSHLFFYLIVLYQTLVLSKNRKKINKNSWIIISIIGVLFLVHFAWITWPILHFRNIAYVWEGNPPPYSAIFQAALGYINWDGRYNTIPSLLKILLISKTFLYLYIISIATKSKNTSGKMFLFFSVISLISFLILKTVFSMIEVDYRYFIFLELLFLNFALKSSAINKNIFAMMMVLNLCGLVPYLSKNFSGSNERLMSELKTISPRFENKPIYTDNEYYYKQALSSLFQRETQQNIDFNLADINKMPQNTRINIILFDPSYKIPEKSNVLYRKDLRCPECDGDLRELVYLEIMLE
jgi:hypothetical protein